MPAVSYSEIRLFRFCKRAHYYKYVRKLERIRKALAPFRGSILHEMLDAYVQSKLHKTQDKDCWDVLEEYAKKYRRLFKEEREYYGDIIGDVERIFEAYLRYYRKDSLKYISSELPVLTWLTPEIRLVGYIDKIVEDEQGRRFIMDHKFPKVIPNAENRYSDLQLLIYVWAHNRENPDQQVDGIIWDYARAKPPTEPDLLKSGELSKRAKIDTDVYTYEQAIKKHGLKKKDYAAFLKTLQGKEKSFFERIKLPRPPKKMVEQIVSEFQIEAMMIQQLEGIPTRSMSGRNCPSCEFYNLCHAELRGHDAEFVEKSQYKTRKRYADEGLDYASEAID